MHSRMLLMFLAWLCCVASFFNLWIWLQARRYEKNNTALKDANLLCAVISCGLCVLLCFSHIVFMEREEQLDTMWQQKWTSMHELMVAKLDDLRIMGNQTNQTNQTEDLYSRPKLTEKMK